MTRFFDPWQGRGASCARRCRRVLKKREARAWRAMVRRWKRERDDHRRFAPLPEWVQAMLRACARDDVGPSVLPTPYWSTIRIARGAKTA